MNIYQVIRKDDGEEVYRYQSDEPIAWNGMAFDTHDHVELPTINDDGSIEGAVIKSRLTKLEFIEKLGDAVFVAILQMAKTMPAVDAWVEKMKLTTPDPDGTSIDLTDTRTIAGLQALEPVLVAQGVVAEGWADEVLNG